MQEIHEFFSQFDGEVTTKVFVHNGQEHFALVSCHDCMHDTPYKIYHGNLANSAIDFIYDNNTLGQVLHTFRDSTSVQRLKENPGDIALWVPLWKIADWLYQSEDLHPYYYCLLATIINLYKREMRDQELKPVADDILLHMAQAFLHLYECLRCFLDACTRTDGSDQNTTNYFDAMRISTSKIQDVLCEQIPVEMAHGKRLVPAIVLHPQTAVDIWSYLLPEYYGAGVIFRRCENCGKCFVTTGVGNPKYCDRTVAGTNKTCKQLVAKEKAHIKNTTNPINILFNRTYKTMYSRVSAGALEKEKFQLWANAARQVRDQCEEGIMTIDDFGDWLEHSRRSPKYR